MTPTSYGFLCSNKVANNNEVLHPPIAPPLPAYTTASDVAFYEAHKNDPAYFDQMSEPADVPADDLAPWWFYVGAIMFIAALCGLCEFLTMGHLAQ